VTPRIHYNSSTIEQDEEYGDNRYPQIDMEINTQIPEISYREEFCEPDHKTFSRLPREFLKVSSR
jgi:hypothetical protein